MFLLARLKILSSCSKTSDFFNIVSYKMIELSNISSSEVRFEIFHLNDDESLDHLFASFMAFLAVKSESYIWNFSPPRVEKTGLGLCGVLEFGDLYDEEWLLLDFLKGKVKRTSWNQMFNAFSARECH